MEKLNNCVLTPSVVIKIHGQTVIRVLRVDRRIARQVLRVDKWVLREGEES